MIDTRRLTVLLPFPNKAPVSVMATVWELDGAGAGGGCLYVIRDSATHKANDQ